MNKFAFINKYSNKCDYMCKINKNVLIYYDDTKPIDIDLIINNNLNDLADVNIFMEPYENIKNCLQQQSNTLKKHQITPQLALTNKLTHLVTYSLMDKPIILENNFHNQIKITHLHFGCAFNQPIRLTNNLIFVKFGTNFNQPIELTHSITYLIIGDRYIHPIILTNNFQLTHLAFGYYFNQSIILPNSLIELIFDFEYNKPIIIPEALNLLILGKNFNQPINLTNNLTHLEFGFSFNQLINFPNNSQLTHLSLGQRNANFTELPNIKYLNIDFNNSHLIENLPDSLETLVIGWNFKLKLNDLPNSIKNLILHRNYNQPIDLIPINLKLLKCSYEYKYQKKFIQNTQCSIEYYKINKWI